MKQVRKSHSAEKKDFLTRLKEIGEKESALLRRIFTMTSSMQERENEISNKELLSLVQLSFQYTAVVKKRLYLLNEINDDNVLVLYRALNILVKDDTKKSKEHEKKLLALEREYASIREKADQMENMSNAVDAIVESRANAIVSKITHLK